MTTGTPRTVKREHKSEKVTVGQAKTAWLQSKNIKPASKKPSTSGNVAQRPETKKP